MSDPATRDDAELRRTLDALLSNAGSGSTREGASSPPEPARPAAQQGASERRHKRGRTGASDIAHRSAGWWDAGD